MGSSPYSGHKLLGTGVIIAEADTGLDDTSCYFANYSKPPIAKTLISNPKPDLSNSKVAQYVYVPSGETQDNVRGHGTHVCGVLAGSNCPNAHDSTCTLYGGMEGVGEL